MKQAKGNYIAGKFVIPAPATKMAGPSSGGKAGIRMISEDPGDLENPVGEFFYSPEAVDAAVMAARKAFPAWSRLSPAARAKFLKKFENALRKNAESLSILITREMGKPLSESRVEIDRLASKVEIASKLEPELVRSSAGKEKDGVRSVLRFRPRGVMAVLSPFNVPAHLAMSQTLSSLMTANTVVLKPSELTPFVGEFLANIFEEAGFPSGVFNLVQGEASVGKALVEHPGVDGIFFTGSWQTGSMIQSGLAAQPQKICALEMGGKNALIVLKDANLKNAAASAYTSAFMTTGQRCNAASRILIEKSISKPFIRDFLKKVEETKIGYGLEPGVFMGPMASKKGQDRALENLRNAPREGFEVLKPGGIFKAPRKGHYLRPSVHLREGEPTLPLRDGTYTDDEVLGPDTAIYIVKNVDEALRINNRVRYGLVTSVFTRSRKNFEKVLAEAQTGLVNWNVATVRSSPKLPFGGLKQSGNNRPAGFFAPYVSTIPTASLEIPEG